MKRKIIQLIYFSTGVSAIMLLALLPYNEALAQRNKTPLHPKLEGVVTGESTPGWIDFREGTSVNPSTFFTDFKEAFELSADDQMKILKTQKDTLGFSHYRYEQYYNNVKVLYGEYMVHQRKDGFVKSANGRVIKGLKLRNAASIGEKQALEYALNFMHATKYLWQNATLEAELKREKKNQNATYFPKGELIYAPNNYKGDFKGEDYKLTWQFKIYTDDPAVTAKNVYVDALTGAVVHYTDLSMNCSTGSGASAFNGNVTLHTQLSGGSYRSLNDCQTTDIYVYNCNGGAASNTFYTDADNTWTNQSAVQAQWGAEMTYDYYFGEHGRQSWDAAAGNMIAYNNAYAGSNNACWGCTGNSSIYYAGNTGASTDDWNTNDIMGHEFTHGVTQSEANLVYSYESGALNESFSDIFGEMVESWSEGNCDYLVGGDRGAIRSFINPNAYSDPDTYLGTNWYSGSGDNGGVHTNSGVQNRWFYLLSEGGSGTTDFGVSYNVTGITRFKARLIAYRALTVYLNSSSQYIDARKASLQAAWDLYGQCSPEIIAVGDAWHAVGVEAQSAQFVNDICGVVPSGDFRQAISVLRGANGCTNSIATGSSVTYYAARDRVILYPGFSSPAGSRFIAYLEPCSSTMYKSSGDNGNMSDPEKGIKAPVVYQKEVPTVEAVLSDNISIAPNPVISAFALSINSTKDVKAQVRIYNSLGIKVKEQMSINLSKGFNRVSFDCSKFSKGVYMVEIIMGGEKTVKKIIKM